MKVDKRTLFPFGYNLMTPLERLRDAGLKVRYVHETGQLMIGPNDKLPKWKAFIAENRETIVSNLDQEKREAALTKLPFCEFESSPVEMREVMLLRIWDDYLALTKEEAEKIGLWDGCAPGGTPEDSPHGTRSALAKQRTFAGNVSSRLRRGASTTKERF